MVDGNLRLRANVWLEQDGQVVLSPWRVRLLQAIGATGSISGAARQMGVDYRCAWDKLDEMETGLGATLVERQIGGSGGGGARLTPEGATFVDRFVTLMDAFEGVMTTEGRASFGSNVERILAPPGHDEARTPCGTPALEET